MTGAGFSDGNDRVVGTGQGAATSCVRTQTATLSRTRTACEFGVLLGVGQHPSPEVALGLSSGRARPCGATRRRRIVHLTVLDAQSLFLGYHFLADTSFEEEEWGNELKHSHSRCCNNSTSIRERALKM